MCQILVSFYRGVTESAPTENYIKWHEMPSFRVTVEWGACAEPRAQWKTIPIRALFTLLPSGRRYRSICQAVGGFFTNMIINASKQTELSDWRVEGQEVNKPVHWEKCLPPSCLNILDTLDLLKRNRDQENTQQHRDVTFPPLNNTDVEALRSAVSSAYSWDSLIRYQFIKWYSLCCLQCWQNKEW